MVRVCILAQSSPSTWVEHYIRAFRACCDTLVAGPKPDLETLKRWDGRDKAADAAPEIDIPCDFDALDDLYALLPGGWTPDLVVGIAGIGGAPLYAKAAALSCPTAFITVDTWQCLLDYREARRYDFVFAAQREFVPHLRATGSPRVFWLPLGCQPEAQPAGAAAPTHDVSFVGAATQPVHDIRRTLLEGLSRRFSVLAQESVFGAEMWSALARGRLVFNHSAVQELNMRIFETMGLGRPLLTNHEAEANGLFELFEEDKHLIVYRSAEDLAEKVARYLEDDAARLAIGKAGQEEALAKHTYQHRVHTLLETVAAHTGAFGPGRAASTFQGDKLLDYLPVAPGVVMDLGLGLSASRVGLRRRGAAKLIGVCGDAGESARRAGSYDEIVSWPPQAADEIDTVVAACPFALPTPPPMLFELVHGLLREGGTLVLRLRGVDLYNLGLDKDLDGFEKWLEARDFHLRLLGPTLEDYGFIFLARKRTRRLRGIVEEVYTRLQVPELDLEELLGRIPQGM